MKNLIRILLISLISLQACKKNEGTSPEPQTSTEVENKAVRDQVNQKIFQIIESGTDFQWSKLSDQDALNAFNLSSNRVTIAWNEESTNDSEKRILLDFILQSENLPASSEKDILIEENNELKVMTLQITRPETFLSLRKMKEAVVVEPAYPIFTQEESLQAANAYNAEMNSNSPASLLKLKLDNQISATTTPTYNLFQNVHYYASDDNHHIKLGWENGLSGDNIGIAVIDGGVMSTDAIFGENGNHMGNNPFPRTFNKFGVYKGSWWNPFAGYDGVYVQENQFNPPHGTQMATQAAGPLGNNTGVAYNANITVGRSSNSIWIDPPANSLAVARAFSKLADDKSVKIISMSQGGILPWIWVERAINKCYKNGKLIFCAGGTFSLPGVQQLFTKLTGFTLYPARLSKVNSCTGIKKLSSTGGVPEWCSNCFGEAKFVFEFNEGEGVTENVNSGTSSYATSSCAGIAALIWARQPSLSRDLVLQKMIAASDYPEKQIKYFGHGRVDVQKYLQNEKLIN